MWADQYINTLFSCCHENKTHVFFCYGLLLFSYNKKNYPNLYNLYVNGV